jgi:hypothetical protein
MTAMRIALQRLLHHQRKFVEPFPHIGMAPSPATPHAPAGLGSCRDSARKRRYIHLRANDDPLAANEHDLKPTDRLRRGSWSSRRSCGCNRHWQKLHRFLTPPTAALVASCRRHVNDRIGVEAVPRATSDTHA